MNRHTVRGQPPLLLNSDVVTIYPLGVYVKYPQWVLNASVRPDASQRGVALELTAEFNQLIGGHIAAGTGLCSYSSGAVARERRSLPL